MSIQFSFYTIFVPFSWIDFSHMSHENSILVLREWEEKEIKNFEIRKEEIDSPLREDMRKSVQDLSQISIFILIGRTPSLKFKFNISLMIGGRVVKNRLD